jgi:diphthamide biosynthesis protein 4
MDLYRVLNVPTTATNAEIKQAYHQSLLAVHPDKQRPSSHGLLNSDDKVTLDTIREAYHVLSDPKRRAIYDRDRSDVSTTSKPRPAHILSLEDFAEDVERWTYPCRCGGVFTITEAEMDQGIHVLGCGGCSELVWVGYELQ